MDKWKKLDNGQKKNPKVITKKNIEKYSYTKNIAI